MLIVQYSVSHPISADLFVVLPCDAALFFMSREPVTYALLIHCRRVHGVVEVEGNLTISLPRALAPLMTKVLLVF